MSYQIEQRWRSPTEGSYRNGIWCIIEDGKAYPYDEQPFSVDDWVRQLAGKTMLDVNAWSDATLTRRSPPGTNEEEWLRLNDTRHPEYTGPIT